MNQIACQQNLQVQWIVQRVLRLYSRYELSLKDMVDEADYAPVTVVSHQAYDRVIQQFVEHLNSIKNFEMASIVCMTTINPFLKEQTLKATMGMVLCAHQKSSV